MASPKRVLVAGVASFLIFGGCGPQGGTDVGNGRSVKLQLQAYDEAAFTSSQSITTSSGVQLDAAWVAVDRLRFVPAVDCEESETEIDVEGPLVADLIGVGVLGGAPQFPVDADTFCELRVGFHELESSSPPPGAPAELVGHSIRLEGSRADGTAFTVTSKLNERLELEASDDEGFALPVGENPLLIAFEIGGWVDALNLDSLGPGPIVVDEDVNADRLAAFDDAVKASIRLLKDADEDGEIDPEEASAGAELAD